MKKMKIINIIILAFLLIFIYANLTFASEEIQLKMYSTTENIISGKSVSIIIKFNKLKNVDQGINAYVGTVKFDPSKFEFVAFEGMNNWNNPGYNDRSLATGEIKVVATRPNFTTEESEFLKIILRAKTNIQKIEEENIQFKDITLANKIDGEIIKINADNISIESEVISSNENDAENKPDNQNASDNNIQNSNTNIETEETNSNSSNKESHSNNTNEIIKENTNYNSNNDKTMIDDKIPNTGVSIRQETIYVVIGTLTFTIIFDYIQIKKYKYL